MAEQKKFNPPTEVRNWIYIILAAVVSAAVVFGFISMDDVTSLMDLADKALGVVVALGFVMASRNTDTKP